MGIEGRGGVMLYWRLAWQSYRLHEATAEKRQVHDDDDDLGFRTPQQSCYMAPINGKFISNTNGA